MPDRRRTCQHLLPSSPRPCLHSRKKSRFVLFTLPGSCSLCCVAYFVLPQCPYYLSKMRHVPMSLLLPFHKHIQIVILVLCILLLSSLVHRDIKPSNLLINHFGAVKISDFGIVKDLDNSMDLATTFVGTLTYMSPERIAGEPYAAPSDIWCHPFSILPSSFALHHTNFKLIHSSVHPCILYPGYSNSTSITLAFPPLLARLRHLSPIYLHTLKVTRSHYHDVRVRTFPY